MRGGEYLIAGAGVLAAFLMAAFVLFGPDDDRVDTRGLTPFHRLDNREPLGPVEIVCKAWSNRPDFDITATPSEEMAGFRVVSDCRTVLTAQP